MKLRGDVRSSKEHQVIERQVKHMVRLVDDLLDVSRITKGKIELTRRPLDLRDVVGKAIEIASPLLEQRRHHFEVEAPPRAIIVEGDEGRLAQVVANLFTNAAKYTEPGGHIVVALTERNGSATVRVRDDGAGISAELLPKIFDLFVQGYQSAERSAGGLGIGLSLVRSLVDIHGGIGQRRQPPVLGPRQHLHRHLADPRRNQVAPLQPDEETTPEALPRSVVRRILVVDDNEDAVELVADLLRGIGHEVRIAVDGPSALKATHSVPAGDRGARPRPAGEGRLRAGVANTTTAGRRGAAPQRLDRLRPALGPDPHLRGGLRGEHGEGGGPVEVARHRAGDEQRARSEAGRQLTVTSSLPSRPQTCASSA